jgi:predicted nucleotidyltransferase
MDPIPHEEIKKIIDAERERSRRGRARIEKRLSDARTEAGRLAHRLAEADPAVRRVFLFGSVASGRVRSERFDIDLAVEGGDHLQLLRRAEESPFSVDLVDLDDVSEGFRRMVEERGVCLYDARG